MASNNNPANTIENSPSSDATTSIIANTYTTEQVDNVLSHHQPACWTTETQPIVDAKCSPLPNPCGLFSSAASQRTLNEVCLVRNRRINNNRWMRKNLELACEDRVSRFKLEEVHCSLPSSVKSTFIMTFSPDGLRAASTHGDHRIYICDLNTGKLLDTLEGHPKTPWCLAWHPTNRDILASGCLAGEVRVWDLNSRACESWTSENNTIITSLDFHPKERILVIATANDIHFWDWSKTVPFAKTTTTHDKEKVKLVVFDSSGTKLITGISNLPRWCGGDPFRSRINDDFMSHGLDQLSTENIAQNSEIASPLNSNETFDERSTSQSTQAYRQSQQEQHIMATPNGLAGAGENANREQEVNYRNTLTLSRVAFLYRQLEALEDSMRHTSFTPYINSRTSINPSSNILNETIGDIPIDAAVNRPNNPGSILAQVSDSRTPSHSETTEQTVHSSSSSSTTITTNTSSSSLSLSSSSASAGDQSNGAVTLTSSTLEPSLVSFDESLEHLQLRPLIMDGQIVNMANIIEQYPIDSPYQLHYVMQFESINQVNQNFIRISKLLSGARLYRQVAQQIATSSSGNSYYSPNQILTAQCASPRSSRNISGMPLVFPSFTNDSLNPSSLMRSGRASDPVLALQFRNSARNVPLVTVCKIDLLTARSICITRSQQLIEQAVSNSRHQLNLDDRARTNTTNNGMESTNNIDPEPNNGRADNEQLHSLLVRLHHSLTSINHNPLSTSNVNTHVLSLRKAISALLNAISSLLLTSDDGRRLINLIHSIARTLTGRDWNMPLGATLDEIKLDVINILCVADLSLHLVRQVQLLQMQRISLLTRIEESRRATANRPMVQQMAESVDVSSSRDPGPSSSNGPSTSSCPDDQTTRGSNKRKSSASGGDCKRTKTTEDVNIDIDQQPRTESLAPLSTPVNNQFNVITGPVNDSIPTDRLLIWNSGQNQSIEQSLQRFFVASGISNSHILVRIYHRMNLGPTIASSGLIDRNPSERIHPPFESRRRAMSQDNSSGVQDAGLPPPSAPIDERGRNGRPTSGSYDPIRSANQPPGSHQSEAWHRHPHLHLYQARGTSPHLWFNQWTIPLPVNHSNYRIQCWDFSLDAIPNIKDSQANLITHKCRIYNDSSIDVSQDGGLLACLVPRDNVATCLPNFDLRIYSLRSFDFGTCYYRLTHGPNAISVSLSPSGQYAVVGLASHKFVSNDPNDDDLTIAKVFKLNGKDNSIGYVRDIKIKKDESALSLNAIKWMHRGIVYNVGPQHHQRYQATRIRNIVAS